MKLTKVLGFLGLASLNVTTYGLSLSLPAVFNNLKPAINTTQTLEVAIDAARTSYYLASPSTFEKNKKGTQLPTYVPDALKNQLQTIATIQDKDGDTTLKTSVQQTTDLSDRENTFIQNRLGVIVQAFQNFTNPGLGIPRAVFGNVTSADNAPYIAVCISGGGCRAMIATLGFWKGMQQTGLDQLVLMTACLSGSTWFTTPWCIGKTIDQLKASYEKYALIPLGSKLTSVIQNPLALPQTAAIPQTTGTLFPERSVISEKFAQAFYWEFPYNLVQPYGNIVSHMTLAAFDDPTILDMASTDPSTPPSTTVDFHTAPYIGPKAMQSRQTVFFSQAADYLNTPDGYTNRPLPLATSITQFNGSWSATADTISKQQHSFDGYNWITYSPFDISMDFYDRKGNRTGARIETQFFGRKFDNIRGHSRSYRTLYTKGKTIGYASVNTSPEYTLSYLQGIWGSAFAISIDYIANGNGLNAIDPDQASDVTDNNSALKFIKKSLFSAIKTPFSTFTNIKDFRLFPAVINNFAVFPDSPFSNYETLITVDAGIAFNLPFPPLLKPERKIDLIIALDASADVGDGQLDALVGAEKWAQAHGIPFPKIQGSKRFAGTSTRPFTIFDEYDNGVTGPVVFYMPLIDDCFVCQDCNLLSESCSNTSSSGSFKVSECLKNACSTFNFQYKPSDVENLSEFVACKVETLKNNILNAIEQIVRKKNNLPTYNSDDLNVPPYCVGQSVTAAA